MFVTWTGSYLEVRCNCKVAASLGTRMLCRFCRHAVDCPVCANNNHPMPRYATGGMVNRDDLRKWWLSGSFSPSPEPPTEGGLDG